MRNMKLLQMKGQPNERIAMISREEFLEFMIEHAINTLSGMLAISFRMMKNMQKNNPHSRQAREGNTDI